MTNNKSIEKLVENIFVKHNWVQRLGKDAVTGEVEIMEVMDDLISDLEDEFKVVAEGKVKLIIEGDEEDYYLAGGYLEGKKNMYLNELLTASQMDELENHTIQIIIKKIK